MTAGTAADKREVRRRVGMLFQGNALFDSMTVAENIGFVLREVWEEPAAKVAARVAELLERLRLGPIGGKYPAELSGGMKKRVGIARAVAHDPEIMFYDDPTAGLDPVTSMVIADLIAELGRGEARAAVVVSNQRPVVLKVARRVVLLKGGRIEELGTPEEAFGEKVEGKR
jgi:phospholipid/cholesterol/gamma-HCH transport system ATP-binding protein